VAKAVKRQTSRTYNSTKRDEQAMATRWAILQAARKRFVEHGYGATTIQAIADEAGVAVQTIYAVFGNKRELLKQVVDISVVGDDDPVPLHDRPASRAAAAEPSKRKRAGMSAAITRSVGEGAAPIYRVIRDAASVDPEVAGLLATMTASMRQAMVSVAVMLAGPRGELRVPIEQAAETLFLLYSPDVGLLCVDQLGWSWDRYEEWLAEMVERTLLK
jgi:AcrR family transcriptional regulator